MGIPTASAKGWSPLHKSLSQEIPTVGSQDYPNPFPGFVILSQAKKLLSIAENRE
jgi:hypothetical protein